MRICAYVYMCICVYVRLYTYVYMCICAYVYAYVYMCIFWSRSDKGGWPYAHMHICTYAHMHICTSGGRGGRRAAPPSAAAVYGHICTCTHTHIHKLYSCTSICCRRSNERQARRPSPVVCTCVCVHVHTCTCAYVHMCICVHNTCLTSSPLPHPPLPQPPSLPASTPLSLSNIHTDDKIDPSLLRAIAAAEIDKKSLPTQVHTKNPHTKCIYNTYI